MKNLLLLFVCLSGSLVSSGQDSLFTDPRDNNSYPLIKLGDYWWFKSDLRFGAPNSWCTENPKHEVCAKTNFYYYIELDNVCPAGWHVPTWDEWKNAVEHIAVLQGISADDLHWEKDSFHIHIKDTTWGAELIRNIPITYPQYLNIELLGWVEGKKLIQKYSQGNLWLKDEKPTLGKTHLHIGNSGHYKHSHNYNIIDTPKKTRRFPVRCLRKE